MIWFKNLFLFRTTGRPIHGWTADSIGAKLADKAFSPCGDLDLERMGWAMPFGCNKLAQGVKGGHIFLNLRVEKKTLPKRVIDRDTERACNAVLIEKGFWPGRDMRHEIRQTVIDSLLPRAFSTQCNVGVWIDTRDGWIGIDTSNHNRAMDVIRLLYHALDDLDGEFVTILHDIEPRAGLDASSREAMAEEFRVGMNTLLR